MILQCACGKKWALKDELAKPGMKIACRACGESIPVPLSLPEEPPDSLEEARKRIRQLEKANASLRVELSRSVEERILEVQRLKIEIAGKEGEPGADAHFLRDLNGFLSSWSSAIRHLQERIDGPSGEAAPEDVPVEDLVETVTDPSEREDPRRVRKTRKR